ncbi:hypothetical protein H5410_039016 [Solanum commersonii]|uniref:Uncharacterized protein n=1 Tax=Solanum commersonii TaxID=4109 RepID=A0A9J5YDW6_SOLCO|nr:hypothetical protein H5410_039016 [Solanum commersonii]
MSLMEKLLYFLPCHNSLLLEESDQNEVQESGTKIQELDFMHYSKISSWDNLPASGLNQSERSIIRRNYCFHVRVGRGANSKVEKKQCPRCSRWCKYYATTSTTIIMCIGCGKKFDPRSNSSSSSHKLVAKSSLHRKQQDHQRLF